MKLQPTTTSQQGATTIGVGLFIACLAVGALVGSKFRATELDSGIHNLTVITTEQGAFNWLLFVIFAGAGAICLAVGLAAAAVSATMHNLVVIEQAERGD